MKNPQTEVYEWFMYVVDQKYIASEQCWEYQVKDTNGNIYKSGEWVSEKRLKDA